MRASGAGYGVWCSLAQRPLGGWDIPPSLGLTVFFLSLLYDRVGGGGVGAGRVACAARVTLTVCLVTLDITSSRSDRHVRGRIAAEALRRRRLCIVLSTNAQLNYPC